ncbi:hypothetical protein ACTHR6_25925 [Ralstonia holmesii]|uniref:hypothetical protein n=1 Tax=Ralstonia TaxID=48736 RepID=UPI00046A58CE|nr:hypothetical protein [Ralstonia pickettii]
MDSKPEQKEPFDYSKLILLGTAAGVLALAYIDLYAGVIPFLGPALVVLAPNIFLVGVALMLAGLMWLVTDRWLIITPLALALTLAIGLNTRIPEAWADANRAWSSMHVARTYTGTVGQPLIIDSKPPLIEGRQWGYGTVRINCVIEQCFQSEGFRTIIPGIENEYWQESVQEVALNAGFTAAAQNERAPRLVVRSEQKDGLLLVHIKLSDSDGSELATGTATYRNGFKAEPRDGNWTPKPPPRNLALQFLLHGNLVSQKVGDWVGHTAAYPLRTFLQQATELSEPQNGTPVVAEQDILRSEHFDPPKAFRQGAEPSESTPKFWDERREKRCRELLQPEFFGARASAWSVFTTDPTRRHKIRPAPLLICDDAAIWNFDYGAMPGHVVVSKYDSEGNLKYRIAIARPASDAMVRLPSFHAEERTLDFEWWSGSHSGSNYNVTSVTRVRVREPA